MNTAAAQAQIGFGEVRHARQRPRGNAFVYPSYFLYLPMRSLRQHGPGALARNRRAALSFFDADHGQGGPDSLAWLEGLLRDNGITDADGEVWLQTYPRVLGYSFKPVSFWYCQRADGSLRAVLAEVNNTFGQRHAYLLDAPRLGQPCWANKVFHVSPFCAVEGRYRFVFMQRPAAAQGGAGTGSPARLVARIDYFDCTDALGEQPSQAVPLLCTSLSGALLPLDPATLRRALWRYPAMTWGVIARIHWQALRLWFKRTPFYRLAPLPPHAVTRVVAGPVEPPLNQQA